MTPVKSLALIASIGLTAACQPKEVAAICTTLGTAETGLSIEVLYPDGSQIAAVPNGVEGQVSVTYQVYADDMVSLLQEAALVALEANVPEGSTLCEGSSAGTLSVLFAGGTARSVAATCPASPLDGYRDALFATFATERTQISSETQVQTMALPSPDVACAEDWRAAF